MLCSVWWTGDTTTNGLKSLNQKWSILTWPCFQELPLERVLKLLRQKFKLTKRNWFGNCFLNKLENRFTSAPAEMFYWKCKRRWCVCCTCKQAKCKFLVFDYICPIIKTIKHKKNSYKRCLLCFFTLFWYAKINWKSVFQSWIFGIGL